MKNFIAIELERDNIAYVVAEDIKRAVEIGTEQNGINRRKTLVTFDDGSTLTSVEPAKSIIAKAKGEKAEVKPASNKPQGSK